MDNPFLHFGRMMIIQRAQDNMNEEVCDAVRKLTLGCFDRESGKLFKDRLTANLDEVLALDAELGKEFLIQRMAFFTFQKHPDDVLSLFAVMRYVFRAISVVDTICELIDEDGEPQLSVRVIYLTEFDKTIATLKEKLTVIQLQQYMNIFKEFYDIAKAANVDGNVAASYFITTRLLNLMDYVCRMALLYMECHPVAMDLLILLCQSLPIMKYPDFILNKIKNVPAFLSDQAQQAQKLKIQAEAYEFKDICSLAIQRGKEARDLLDTDEDKEEMTELIKRMEDKQRLKEAKSAVKIQPEPEPVKKQEKTKHKHDEAAGSGKFVVHDIHIEPVIRDAESQIVNGQFSCSTAKQFHESIIKYLISRAKEEEMFTEDKLSVRFITGLDMLRKNLSESRDVWLGILRYVYHVISLLGVSCKRDKTVTDTPETLINEKLSELIKECLPRVFGGNTTDSDVAVLLEEFMEIAKLALTNGNRDSCLYLTDCILRLHMQHMSGGEERMTLLPDLFLLNISSVDIKIFSDYVIGVCKMASSFPCCTRAQKGKALEFEAMALKEKQKYNEAIKKAKLSEATFQITEDKDRLTAFIKSLEKLEKKKPRGSTQQKT